MDPMSALFQALQGAGTIDEAAERAAALSPPPPANFKPATPQIGPGFVAPMQDPGVASPMAQLSSTRLPNFVPPMTQGEARTAPRLGDILLGG